MGNRRTELLAEYAPVLKEYLESEDNKTIQAACKKKNDDNEYRNDTDPAGYKLYQEYLENKFDITFFVERVIKKNW
jgi:hypothetical protein